MLLNHLNFFPLISFYFSCPFPPHFFLLSLFSFSSCYFIFSLFLASLFLFSLSFSFLSYLSGIIFSFFLFYLSLSFSFLFLTFWILFHLHFCFCYFFQFAIFFSFLFLLTISILNNLISGLLAIGHYLPSMWFLYPCYTELFISLILLAVLKLQYSSSIVILQTCLGFNSRAAMIIV